MSDNINRKNEMVNSFLDTGYSAATDWGNNFISKNTPKALDWIVNKAKEQLASIKNSFGRSFNNKISDSTIKCICCGLEIGEELKEEALVMSMKDMGFEDNQIKQILESSQQYLITKDEFVERLQEEVSKDKI